MVVTSRPLKADEKYRLLLLLYRYVYYIIYYVISHCIMRCNIRPLLLFEDVLLQRADGERRPIMMIHRARGGAYNIYAGAMLGGWWFPTRGCPSHYYYYYYYYYHYTHWRPVPIFLINAPTPPPHPRAYTAITVHTQYTRVWCIIYDHPRCNVPSTPAKSRERRCQVAWDNVSVRQCGLYVYIYIKCI